MSPQRSFQRAIARATGDSLATIRRLGFQAVDPHSALNDGEEFLAGPSVFDWDGLTSVPLAELVTEDRCEAA